MYVYGTVKDLQPKPPRDDRRHARVVSDGAVGRARLKEDNPSRREMTGAAHES